MNAVGEHSSTAYCLCKYTSVLTDREGERWGNTKVEYYSCGQHIVYLTNVGLVSHASVDMPSHVTLCKVMLLW